MALATAAAAFPPLMKLERSTGFLRSGTRASSLASLLLLLPPPLRLHPRSLSLSFMSTPQVSGNSSPADAAPSKTVRVVVKGRVQGVFYRNWTVDNATQLGLNGWVRNRRDGSVEALFSGRPDAVQEMEQRCRRGPPDAIVTGLEVNPSNDDPGSGFERKATV